MDTYKWANYVYPEITVKFGGIEDIISGTVPSQCGNCDINRYPL